MRVVDERNSDGVLVLGKDCKVYWRSSRWKFEGCVGGKGV